jgi:hypothetical protein
MGRSRYDGTGRIWPRDHRWGGFHDWSKPALTPRRGASAWSRLIDRPVSPIFPIWDRHCPRRMSLCSAFNSRWPPRRSRFTGPRLLARGTISPQGLAAAPDRYAVRRGPTQASAMARCRLRKVLAHLPPVEAHKPETSRGLTIKVAAPLRCHSAGNRYQPGRDVHPKPSRR